MDRATVGVALLLVGFAVAAHPLYLDLNPGDTTVDVTAERVDGDVAERGVTNASTLAEPARTTLREAVADGEATRWRGADGSAVRPLIETDYVRLDGDIYRVRVLTGQGLLGHVDTVVSPLVVLVGLLGAFVGVRTAWDASRRPDESSPSRDGEA